jgi:hypothetical protein
MERSLIWGKQGELKGLQSRLFNGSVISSQICCTKRVVSSMNGELVWVWKEACFLFHLLLIAYKKGWDVMNGKLEWI